MDPDQGSTTLAAAGDAIITRPLSVYQDGDLEYIMKICKNSDISFANLETLIHEFEGYPAPHNPTFLKSGTYMQAPPQVADELSHMGFDILATGNNHSADYSHGGMEATMRELEKRDYPYAGMGRNLTEARSPGYAETPAGRVGLVHACSTYQAGADAGNARPDIQGRPGISPLELEVSYTVSTDTFKRIQEISEALGLEELKRVEDDDDSFCFWNVDALSDIYFKEGDTERIERRVNEQDEAEILNQVRAADKQADWVIASLHTHEGPDGEWSSRSTPEFLESFARKCIDAGADVFVGHGPHMFRGIEIHNGAPIFYSLGSFIQQNLTIPKSPADHYETYNLNWDSSPADLADARAEAGFMEDREVWEGALPICHFEDGRLDHIELHPIDLGFDKSRPRRGTPLRSDDEKGERIITEISELSEKYDTEIAYEDGIGVIATSE